VTLFRDRQKNRRHNRCGVLAIRDPKCKVDIHSKRWGRFVSFCTVTSVVSLQKRNNGESIFRLVGG
jgi:hypothetical protein